MTQAQALPFKITTSEKAPVNHLRSLIYHNGKMLPLNNTDFIGKNGKIKAGWYYVYLQNGINAQTFSDEFNKLNYSNTDKKVDTVSTFIINNGIIQKCVGRNAQQPQILSTMSTQLVQPQIQPMQQPQILQTTPATIAQMQIPVFQSDSPQKHKSPTKKSPTNTTFTAPVQANIISPITKIIIECATGRMEYTTPIDKSILDEIIRNIAVN